MSHASWTALTGLSGLSRKKKDMKLAGVILEGYVGSRRKRGLHMIIFYFMHL